MANYKRKKSKRHIRCSICTKYRHLGNTGGSGGRHTRKKQIMDKEKPDFTDYSKED